MRNGVRRHGHVCQRSQRAPFVGMQSRCGRQPHLKRWAYTLSAVWARGVRVSHPVVHPVRHQGGKSEYVTVRTTAPEDTAKGARGPSVQTQWVCVQQPRPKTWPYTSQDETAFIQLLGLVTWLRGARCPVFRCGCVRHVLKDGGTVVSKGRPRVPKERKRPFIPTRLVRVWATITSGCTRGAKGGDPVHPGIKVVSRST